MPWRRSDGCNQVKTHRRVPRLKSGGLWNCGAIVVVGAALNLCRVYVSDARSNIREAKTCSPLYDSVNLILLRYSLVVGSLVLVLDRNLT